MQSPDISANCFVLGEVGYEPCNFTVLFVLLDSKFLPFALLSLYHPNAKVCSPFLTCLFVYLRSYAFLSPFPIVPTQILIFFFFFLLEFSGWTSAFWYLDWAQLPFLFSFLPLNPYPTLFCLCHKVLWQAGMELEWDLMLHLVIFFFSTSSYLKSYILSNYVMSSNFLEICFSYSIFCWRKIRRW